MGRRGGWRWRSTGDKRDGRADSFSRRQAPRRSVVSLRRAVTARRGQPCPPRHPRPPHHPPRRHRQPVSRQRQRRRPLRLPASPVASAAPAVSAASPVAAASASPAAATGPTGGQVSLLYAKPVTFHPLFTSVGADQGVEQLLFGALVKVNDKLESVPDIAEKIDVSADAKIYTFHLKKLPGPMASRSPRKMSSSPSSGRWTSGRPATGAVGCSNSRARPNTAIRRRTRSPA